MGRPGERYRSVLDPYRDSAAAIDASDLEYTILRPVWFKESLRTKPSVDSRVKALADEWLVFFECTVAAEYSFERETGFDGDAS
jgi:hypothetical protein